MRYPTWPTSRKRPRRFCAIWHRTHSTREGLLEVALRQVLADASIADRTKRIFERVALNGEAPEAVAASFKMSRHAVDQAKGRVLARLRELVKKLEVLADA